MLPPPAACHREAAADPLLRRLAAPQQPACSGSRAEGASSEGSSEDVDALLGMLMPSTCPVTSAGAAAEQAAGTRGGWPPEQGSSAPAAAVAPTVDNREAPNAGTAAAYTRGRHAKVLTWLSDSSDSSPADAIPAVPAGRQAAAPVPSAARQPAPALHGTPASAAWQPRPPPAAQGPAPHAASPPAYYAQRQPLEQQRRLTLARPACPGCGRAEPECVCPAAVFPLRLLRPRQADYVSHARRRQQPDACAGGVAMPPAPPGALCSQNHHQQQAGISNQTAYSGSWQGEGQPGRWVPHAPARLEPAQATGTSSTGAELSASQSVATLGRADIDIWRAYLAGRRRQSQTGEPTARAQQALRPAYRCCIHRLPWQLQVQ